MDRSDLDRDSLKIGDYVMFSHAKLSCHLSVEGILTSALVGTDNLSTLHDAIFCVHLLRQYSASRELANFLQEKGSAILDEGDQKYWKALERGRDNENKLNDSYMKKKQGQVVVFGDIIQLFHVKSGKYLTVLPSTLALKERENVRVTLSSDGDRFSWLQVCPRFKIDRDGDRILSNAEVYLQVTEKGKEFIHLADGRVQHSAANTEVNCSLEQTSWKLNIFQSSADTADTRILLASQLVYIHDPEIQRNLTVAPPKSKLVDGDNPTTASSSVQSHSDGEGSDHGYVHPHGDIVLETVPEGQLNSNFLWFLESSSALVGGPVRWKTEQVRFRHMNTNKYLQQAPTATDADGKTQYIFTTTDKADREGTLFSLNELNSTSKLLSNAKALQIGQDGVWIERGGKVPDSVLIAVQGTKDKSAALNLIVHRFSGRVKDDKTEDDDAVTDNASAKEEAAADSAIGSKEPMDVFVGLSARGYLRQYNDLTVMPGEDDASNTIWPGGDRADVAVFETIVRKIVLFVEGHPIMDKLPDKPVLTKPDQNLRRQRQSLLREQGSLETVLHMIEKLKGVAEMAEAARGGRQSVDDSLLVKMGQTVLGLCFALLYCAVQDHPENQMYVADYLSVLMAHLNTQELAVKCVTEMLSKNVQLQETKISVRDIQLFVDKLRSFKMNAMYLQLLQACCSCQGKGVDSNQGKVARLLFSDEVAEEVIVSISADYNHLHSVKFAEARPLYLAGRGSEESPIRGDQLRTRGLPRLTLHWTVDGERVSMDVNELFDKHAMPVARGSLVPMSFKDNPSNKSAAGNDSLAPLSMVEQRLSAVQESKLAAADYFVAEMFLGAEMCMDRNYIAMHKLDALFPFEVLVTIMKMDVSVALRSAACRLLMCLHVDRDPQASSLIPCLTRCYKHIKENADPQLPYVEVKHRQSFALVQQMISEHLSVEMAGKLWTEYSFHVLKMLHALAEFNFYGTNEKMIDVIQPLIDALDRRQVKYPNTGDAGRKSGQLQNGSSSMLKSVSQASLQNSASFRFTDASARDLLLNEDDDDDNRSQTSSRAEREAHRLESGRKYELVLRYIDSQIGHAVVCAFVMCGLALDLYQISTGSSFRMVSLLFILQAIVLAMFVIEISARFYCTYRSQGRRRFFENVINVVDVAAVGANIVGLFAFSEIDDGLSFVKVFRLLRLYLVFKRGDAAVLVGDDEELDRETENLVVAERYSRPSEHELATMVEGMDILAYMQSVIEDRNISLLMRKFYEWESSNGKSSAVALFKSVVEVESQELSLGQEKFDPVMLDVFMFNHTPLVQSALEVFMAHHSLRRTLLDNLAGVQLLASQKRENQFVKVNAMLQKLEQAAETHELWGNLEKEEDRVMNVQTKDILRDLTKFCRVSREVLEFDEEFSADVEMQNLYRNLDCFAICMKVLGLHDSVEPDENGEFDEVALNTRELCLMCNDLVYWYLLGNTKNQEIGYEKLQLFLDTLDAEINSHRVVRALFKGNEDLMRHTPHQHLTDLVDRIVKDGKSPHYLALFASITHVGERNVIENQFQIVKSLTSPGALQNVSCFFCPVDHPDYEEKRALMAPFLAEPRRDLSLDDLPPKLAYHLMFLEVLSGCTVGRASVTTVEAKVQSVFNYEDILQSVLDPGTITIARTKLSLFFYNSIIEVELKISGLERSALMWRLLESYVSVLGYAKDDLRIVEKQGWSSEEVSRQQIEYIIVCIKVAGGFFKCYYDKSAFHFGDSSSVSAAGGGGSGGGDKVQISQMQVNELVASLFGKVKEIYDLDSPRLNAETKHMIFDTLEALNEASSKIIVSNLQKNTVLTTKAESRHSADHQTMVSFTSFVSQLESNTMLREEIERENHNFIDLLEKLPRAQDRVEADVRYETLITKLVMHIRQNIKIVANQKRLDARSTNTARWIICVFRTMIEKRMGMTIDQRDDEGGAEQDEAAAPVVNALNACGATALCLDLIADGVDDNLQLEAVKLCVGLLFKEGGAKEVQALMHTHLSKTNSELFFKQVRLTLCKLQDWHEYTREEGEDVNELPPSILIVRFLQLMCEGHYIHNQDIMREQPHNAVSYNLLSSFVAYLDSLSRHQSVLNTEAAIRVANTILEVIQGPCEGNQKHFALETELIETLNRINRSKTFTDCETEKEIELKKVSIDIFQGLLEGQGERSVVYERVLSVIHLDIVQMMSKGSPEVLGSDGKLLAREAPTEAEEILQTECVVLLQMLCNFKPSLYDELGISRNVDDKEGSGTAMIEIIWRNDIHRRFFHVPKICAFLAKSSKDALVTGVDRTNAENKLIDFLARSQDLYLEVKHQQLLTNQGLSKVFSRENQDRATWCTFFFAIMINALFIVYYNTDTGAPDIQNTSALTTIYAFNWIQTLVAIFVLILSIVVRTPVVYQKNLEMKYTDFQTVLYTACDFKTLYFVLYLVLSLFGLFLADYFLPFLLLDIVSKNATTRDVLNAVVIPRKQLGMTVVLGIFLTYIYAYFIFLYFRGELGGFYGVGVEPGNQDCHTLFGCFKFVLAYGLRQGGGVGDVMNLNIGSRWLIDTSYFLVMIVMLLNIIFGIIIDTFGSLRAQQNERLIDTTEVCFICGIDKQTFDRASDEPDGFKEHIKIDHNMWNYLYFIFMLEEQDKDDDDGLEQFVRQSIEAKEILWMPLNKAIRLDQAASEEEQTLRRISAELDDFERLLAKKVTHFHSEMHGALDQIATASHLDFKSGDAKTSIARYLQSQAPHDGMADDGADSVTDIGSVDASAIHDDEQENLLTEEQSLHDENEDEELREGDEEEDEEDDEDEQRSEGLLYSEERSAEYGERVNLDDSVMNSLEHSRMSRKSSIPSVHHRPDVVVETTTTRGMSEKPLLQFSSKDFDWHEDEPAGEDGEYETAAVEQVTKIEQIAVPTGTQTPRMESIVEKQPSEEHTVQDEENDLTVEAVQDSAAVAEVHARADGDKNVVAESQRGESPVAEHTPRAGARARAVDELWSGVVAAVSQKGAQLTQSGNSPMRHFAVSSRVLVDRFSDGHFESATILADLGDGSYDVEYVDGDMEGSVSGSRIRPPPPPPHSTAPQAKGRSSNQDDHDQSQQEAEEEQPMETGLDGDSDEK